MTAATMANDTGRVVHLTSVRPELGDGVIGCGLEDRGIRATMSGVYTTNFRTEAPGWVEILVAEDDLQNARAVLEEVRVEHGTIDWSQVDVGEPEDTDDPHGY